MVHDYNWSSLMENGKLGTLTVMELEKYIKHHSLPNKGNKPDKIRCIALHLSSDRESYVAPEVNQEEEGEESEEEEEVLAEILTDSEYDDDGDSGNESSEAGSVVQKISNTRYGRSIVRPRAQDDSFFTEL